jgi:hypothetical protein
MQGSAGDLPPTLASGVTIHRSTSIYRYIVERSKCIDATLKHRCISLYYTLLFRKSPCAGVCDTFRSSAPSRSCALLRPAVHLLNEAIMSKKSTCLIGRVSSLASSSSSTANPTANSQDDVQAIASPLGYKSAVWKYFGFLKKDGSTDKTHAICKKCRSAIKYSGNTTNLSGHLIKKHGIDPHAATSSMCPAAARHCQHQP